MERIESLSYYLLGISPVELNRLLRRKLSFGEYRKIQNLNEWQMRTKLESILTKSDLSYLGINKANPNNLNNIIELPPDGGFSRFNMVA